jgi:hypothetical protein
MSPPSLPSRRVRPLTWSPVTESNRRPSPYHGDALPTELTGPVFSCRFAPSRAPRREHSASCAVVMRSTLRTGATGLRQGEDVPRMVSGVYSSGAAGSARWTRHSLSGRPERVLSARKTNDADPELGWNSPRSCGPKKAARRVPPLGNGDAGARPSVCGPASVTARSSGSRWRCRTCRPSITGWRWHLGRRG